MLDIHLTIYDPGIQSLLQQLQNKLENVEPALHDIGVTLESRIAQRFETRTDPQGRAWKEWAKSTDKYYPDPGTKATAKAGRPANRRLLDRYGDMLEGLSSQTTANSVRIGFNQPYAIYHEYSTKHMPRRGLLTANPETATLSDTDTQAVMDILQKFLQLS